MEMSGFLGKLFWVILTVVLSDMELQEEGA